MTADEFRTIRKAKGMTQTALAKAMGIGRQSVWNYETGKQPIPRLVEAFMAVLEEVRGSA